MGSAKRFTCAIRMAMAWSYTGTARRTHGLEQKAANSQCLPAALISTICSASRL